MSDECCECLITFYDAATAALFCAECEKRGLIARGFDEDVLMFAAEAAISAALEGFKYDEMSVIKPTTPSATDVVSETQQNNKP